MTNAKRALFHAIDRKDTDRLAALLNQGVDPNTIESAGYFVNRTALMYAAACQFSDGVELLLKRGADVNAATLQGAGAGPGYTALHAAITGNEPKPHEPDVREAIVEMLLRAGADANTVYGGDTTPLWLAASAGYLTLTQLLIRSGAKVRAVNTGTIPALHGAAQGCRQEIARILLDAGAPIDEQTPSGGTPLMTAAYRGCEPLVRFFIEKGANVNHRAADGRTPLISAALYAQDTVTERQHDLAWRIVNLLLDAGADPKARNLKGESALDIASRSEGLKAAESIKRISEGS